ncbi:zinc finger, C2H2 type [Ancylostoma duodenale]|uniref:Zinc finger, C2H2 type n=1 Tax=Ancylostoma duodenale TaxID=51022 RepID=A0A0C2GQ19_9BILA|nr:zinc finger, C2H2 type [Ancylostoma duodenale]
MVFFTSVKHTFSDEVKKELTNRQSFLKSATSVVRYLQAARILYNRLDWKERRKYEYAARERARAEHAAELKDKGGITCCPLLFVLFMHNFLFFFFSSEICEIQWMTNCLFLSTKAVQIGCDSFQGHMLEHHSCAHVFACHFCGLVFPSLEALKAHDGCEEFAAALVQRISSSGEVEFHMNFATLVMVCTDCGSQLLVRSSYIGESSIAHWREIVNFHMLHNAEKVVPVIIYSQEDFTPKLRLRIQAMTSVVKGSIEAPSNPSVIMFLNIYFTLGIQTDCPYCGKCDFDSVEALESHFLSHEESVKKCCPECGMQFSQEGFYREHLLSHLGTKACYLAVHLSRVCTFITGDSFDPENVLRVNGFFYTAVNSKDESEETSTPYNLHAEFHSFVEESPPETGTKLADDISRRFSRNCRLAGGKALSKKHSPSHRGLFSELVPIFTLFFKNTFVSLFNQGSYVSTLPLEITNMCYLCDPPHSALDTPELYSNHVHTKHTSPPHLSKEKKHTEELHCMVCKNEPLEALREHVLSHLTESSEVCVPQRTLFGCRNVEIFWMPEIEWTLSNYDVLLIIWLLKVYGVPLGMECFMYLCQQCAVAFEDPHRARKHLAQHMVKGPALWMFSFLQVARIAVPTLCSHRTFITFGDAFTTCPEDPSRCFGLVR